MATFMSGTDIKELTDSAPLHNCFMSLVVNNAGTYTVAFSTLGKNTTKTVKREAISFRNFNGEDVICDEVESTTETSIDAVYYAYGNITKEELDFSPFQYISDQLTKIKEVKSTANTKATSTYKGTTSSTDWRNKYNYNIHGNPQAKPAVTSPGYKSESTYMKPLFNGIYDDDYYGDYPTSYNKPTTSIPIKPASTDDNKQFCNSILTLGLRSEYIDNVTSFLDDLAITDVELYETYLPTILDAYCNVVFAENYIVYKEALDFALNFFKKYNYDYIIKAIIPILEDELEAVEGLLKD